MSASRFILSFLAFVLLLTAVLAGFNLVVDPYLVFDSERRVGFNDLKPSVETHERMMKAYQSTRVQAATVLLGSSRTDLGFDPARKIWSNADQPVYNLSLVGTGSELSLRFLQHMMYANGQTIPIKTVIVGLDFEDFLDRPDSGDTTIIQPTQKGADDERLSVQWDGQPNPDRRFAILKDQATSLLSLDGVIDSVRTVIANRSTGHPNIEANGHLSEGRFRQWVEADGYAALFEQKNAPYVQRMSNPHYLLRGVEGAQMRGTSRVKPILDFAKKHRLKLIFALQPAHASRLEILDYLGYWPAYEQWRRGLTQEIGRAESNGLDVSLWDFGTYTTAAQESVPADGDRRSAMRGFWDPVHYSSAVGDLMLSRMLNLPGAAEFGQRLRPDSIDAHLREIRTEQQRYRLSQPAEVSRVWEMYRHQVDLLQKRTPGVVPSASNRLRAVDG